MNKPCSGGKCVNTPGGFECRCDAGLELDESGLICLDRRRESCWLDYDQNTCGENVPGRFTAELCCATKGKGWGDECRDCALIPRQCAIGFEFDHTTERCQDINECIHFPEHCSDGAECINTIGSFHCSCPDGLTLDSAQVNFENQNS